MSQDDEDSMFEQALKGDLPSTDEQARLRKRLFAAGLSAGSGLAATSAASAQAGWGGAVAAKVAALSWPMTLVLGAAVAAPIVALPIWLGPSKAKSALVAFAPPRTPLAAPKVSPAPLSEVAVESAPAPSTPVQSAAAVSPRAAGASVVTAGHASEPPSAPANALPAVAAFAAPSSADSADGARGASTLAAETALLDRAFAELAAGHRASAAALIAEHARRFPNGLLSQERERARARLEQNSQNSRAE